MYGLWKSFTIKFPLSLFRKILFSNIIFSLDGWLDTNMVVTYWNDEMFYGKSACMCVTTRWNHEKNDEIIKWVMKPYKWM